MLKLTLALAALFLLVPARALAGEASIFYYPWYGTPQLDGSYQHWDQGGHVPPIDLASTYYPARGPYSSSDVRVVGAQMREIAKAGIREIVSSWWGWGSIEDDRLPMIARMARAQGLQVAVQIEPYPDRTATTVQADLVHLRQLGIARFYVYHPFEIDEASWAPLLGGLTGVQVLAQTTNIARAASAGFAGIYTYDIVEYGPATFAAICARARQAHLLCAPSVGPGFDALRATSDTHSRPRRNGVTYDAMWQAAIDARADRVTITSYNEWHEGTQIEPALAPVPRGLASGSRRAASPVVEAYASYDGAYGSHGARASRAYLARTAFWTALYRTGRGLARSPSVSAIGNRSGRELMAHAEAKPMVAAHRPSLRIPRALCGISRCRPVCAIASNLRLEAEPSRLNPAVRVTDAYLLARPFGQTVDRPSRIRDRSCRPPGRPATLIQPSVVRRYVRSSRSSCTISTKQQDLGVCKLLVDRG